MFKNFMKKVRKQFKRNKNRTIFNDLYKNINGEYLSKKDRGTIIKDDFSLIYGEIEFNSLVDLLELSEVKSGEVFYDLGSGVGKAVITAALTQDFSKCIGIELLPSLYRASLDVLERMDVRENIKFIQGDFFKQDLHEADIIFINATGFFGEVFDNLVKQLVSLRPGTRIIILSKLLKDDNFKLLHQDLHIMSWGWARVSVYRLQAS